MKRVLYLFNVGRIERLGTQCPNEFFYGASQLDGSQFQVEMLGPHPPTQGLVGDDGSIFPLPVPLRRVTGWLKSRGSNFTFLTRVLQILFSGRQTIREADIIIAVTSPWIFALNLLRHLRVVKTPFIGIAFGPFPEPRSIKQRATALFRKILYSGAKIIFTGDADRENFLKFVCDQRDDTALMYFGVDENFWQPGTGKTGDYVFAIGNAFRDYDTLFAAWQAGESKLTVVARNLEKHEGLKEGIDIKSGIWHSAQLSDGDIRDFYQSARYVITPLVETSRPAGQSATLQAMACGKAVIISSISGLWDPSTMTHLDNCYLVAPGDVEAMKSAIDYFESRPDEVARIGANARTTVEQHYTTTLFTRQLEGFVKQQLEQPA